MVDLQPIFPNDNQDMPAVNASPSIACLNGRHSIYNRMWYFDIKIWMVQQIEKTGLVARLGERNVCRAMDSYGESALKAYLDTQTRLNDLESLKESKVTENPKN